MKQSHVLFMIVLGIFIGTIPMSSYASLTTSGGKPEKKIDDDKKKQLDFQVVIEELSKQVTRINYYSPRIVFSFDALKNVPIIGGMQYVIDFGYAGSGSLIEPFPPISMGVEPGIASASIGLIADLSGLTQQERRERLRKNRKKEEEKKSYRFVSQPSVFSLSAINDIQIGPIGGYLLKLMMLIKHHVEKKLIAKKPVTPGEHNALLYLINENREFVAEALRLSVRLMMTLTARTIDHSDIVGNAPDFIRDGLAGVSEMLGFEEEYLEEYINEFWYTLWRYKSIGFDRKGLYNVGPATYVLTFKTELLARKFEKEYKKDYFLQELRKGADFAELVDDIFQLVVEDETERAPNKVDAFVGDLSQTELSYRGLLDRTAKIHDTDEDDKKKPVPKLEKFINEQGKLFDTSQFAHTVRMGNTVVHYTTALNFSETIRMIIVVVLKALQEVAKKVDSARNDPSKTETVKELDAAARKKKEIIKDTVYEQLYFVDNVFPEKAIIEDSRKVDDSVKRLYGTVVAKSSDQEKTSLEKQATDLEEKIKNTQKAFAEFEEKQKKHDALRGLQLLIGWITESDANQKAERIKNLLQPIWLIGRYCNDHLDREIHIGFLGTWQKQNKANIATVVARNKEKWLEIIYKKAVELAASDTYRTATRPQLDQLLLAIASSKEMMWYFVPKEIKSNSEQHQKVKLNFGEAYRMIEMMYRYFIEDGNELTLDNLEATVTQIEKETNDLRGQLSKNEENGTIFSKSNIFSQRAKLASLKAQIKNSDQGVKETKKLTNQIFQNAGTAKGYLEKRMKVIREFMAKAVDYTLDANDQKSITKDDLNNVKKAVDTLPNSVKQFYENMVALLAQESQLYTAEYARLLNLVTSRYTNVTFTQDQRERVKKHLQKIGRYDLNADALTPKDLLSGRNDVVQARKNYAHDRKIVLESSYNNLVTDEFKLPDKIAAFSKYFDKLTFVLLSNTSSGDKQSIQLNKRQVIRGIEGLASQIFAAVQKIRVELEKEYNRCSDLGKGVTGSATEDNEWKIMDLYKNYKEKMRQIDTKLGLDQVYKRALKRIQSVFATSSSFKNNPGAFIFVIKSLLPHLDISDIDFKRSVGWYKHKQSTKKSVTN